MRRANLLHTLFIARCYARFLYCYSFISCYFMFSYTKFALLVLIFCCANPDNLFSQCVFWLARPRFTTLVMVINRCYLLVDNNDEPTDEQHIDTTVDIAPLVSVVLTRVALFRCTTRQQRSTIDTRYSTSTSPQDESSTIVNDSMDRAPRVRSAC
jgi:hypothetical protein